MGVIGGDVFLRIKKKLKNTMTTLLWLFVVYIILDCMCYRHSDPIASVYYYFIFFSAAFLLWVGECARKESSMLLKEPHSCYVTVCCSQSKSVQVRQFWPVHGCLSTSLKNLLNNHIYYLKLFTLIFNY